MSRFRLIQLSRGIVLACLVLFVVMNIKVPSISNVPFDTVWKKAVDTIQLEGYSTMSNQEIKRFLNLNPQEYKNIRFLRIDDPMQADEMVIVEFQSTDQSKDFEEKVKAHMDSQNQIYDGYAPEEAKLVKKGIVDVKGNYALYVVGPDAKKIEKQFESGLKE